MCVHISEACVANLVSEGLRQEDFRPLEKMEIKGKGAMQCAALLCGPIWGSSLCSTPGVCPSVNSSFVRPSVCVALWPKAEPRVEWFRGARACTAPASLQQEFLLSANALRTPDPRTRHPSSRGARIVAAF